MYGRLRRLPVLMLLLLGPCGGVALADAEPSPIPVSDLFANAAFSAPRLAPDGSRMSVVVARGEDRLIMVRPVAGGELTPIARADNDELRLKSVWWPNPDHLLLGATMRNLTAVGMRSRASRLFGIAASGGKLRWLGRRWPFFARVFLAHQDRIVHDLPEQPDHVLVEYGGAIRRMNVTSGALRSHHGAKRFVYQWFVSDDAQVRAGAGVFPVDEYFAVARDTPDGDFYDIIRRPFWPAVGPDLVGVSPNPGIVYVRALKDGRFALYEWDLDENALGALLFAHQAADIFGFATGSDRHTLIAVPYVDDVLQFHILDPAFRKVYASLLRQVRKDHGAATELAPVSSSRDGRARLFAASGPTTPLVYYFYDATANRLTKLIETAPAIPTDRLSLSTSVEYEARDGMRIPAVLTLPRGFPETGLPLIVIVHGGPGERDWLRWDAEVQLFASRGYAVLQPNHRGSTGFGVAHASAGDKEWGEAIQDDVSDGVQWLVARGIADADRVGIYGAELGGYTALMGAVKSPELYRAVAGFGGVYDLEEMIDDNQWYNYWSKRWHEHLIGDDSKRMARNSPLQRAREIQVPVLLGHGGDDPQVHPGQSRDMHRALKRAGKQVEYMEFENEVDGFLFERNRIQFYTRLAAFFDEHLAPRGQEAAEAEEPAAGSGG